eukprot:jgi/Psemu1/19586/gm1.19586_g
MKSTKPSQSTSIDRSYQSPPPRKKPKAQESQKSKSPITSFRCICNWGDYTYQGMEIPVCEFMFNQFQTRLEDGHPWKNQLIKFTTGTTVKSLAFKAAVFEIFKVSADQKSFRLARHHFSPTLLTNDPGQLHSVLTPKKSSHGVFYCSNGRDVQEKVCWKSITTKKWVLGRAESFSSPRKSQTSDLNAVTSKRPLLPSIESIYAGLISHYKQAQTLEEIQAVYQCQWLANKIGFTPDFFDKLLEEFQNKDGCGDEILEGKDLMEERRAISMSTDISEIQKVSIFPPDMMIDDKIKSWLNIIGKAENGSSYSEVLMDNDAFKDYAAASMLTQGIKEWFKKIILGQADVMFDSLCQKINLQLLKFLVKTPEERKRARSKRAAIGISFHMKLFKMLQHRNMNGVISGTTSDEERRGIATIVLILNEEMKKKQRKGLVKYTESKMAKEQGKKKYLDVRDVNKILGIEEEESENGLQLQKEIYFLSGMRFYTEEALQSQAYLDKCYDSFLRSSNRGRLTLKIGNDPDATLNAKDDILKNDELLEVFLDCSKGDVYLGKLSEKKKIFAELVDKVINARFSEEIGAYREEHTARGTKYKGTNLTMREEIDVIGSRKRASSNTRERCAAAHAAAAAAASIVAFERAFVTFPLLAGWDLEEIQNA